MARVASIQSETIAALADRLVALELRWRRKAAIFFRRFPLQKLFLGEDRFVVATISERADHCASDTLVGLFYKAAQLIFTVDELFFPRGKIVTMVKAVTAGIDEYGARAIAAAAAHQRDNAEAK